MYLTMVQLQAMSLNLYWMGSVLDWDIGLEGSWGHFFHIMRSFRGDKSLHFITSVTSYLSGIIGKHYRLCLCKTSRVNLQPTILYLFICIATFLRKAKIQTKKQERRRLKQDYKNSGQGLRWKWDGCRKGLLTLISESMNGFIKGKKWILLVGSFTCRNLQECLFLCDISLLFSIFAVEKSYLKEDFVLPLVVNFIYLNHGLLFKEPKSNTGHKCRHTSKLRHIYSTGIIHQQLSQICRHQV